MKHTATYSPDDNKLRLYPAHRLDAEEYAKVKAAGFKWAPKQELFVAPMWTTGREDLLLELAGEIDDEDKSLVQRAEERAERFEDYSDKRGAEAEHARKAVDAICDGIPLGQPILVGHHSEKHARRDQERIQGGMRKAIKLWDLVGYWKSRAEGAIHAAKYKERPDVRARRIKKIEADLRKVQKLTKDATAYTAFWHKIPEGTNNGRETAMRIANFDHVSRSFPLADFPRDPPASQYEGPMGLWSALDGDIITWQQARDIAIRVHTAGNERRARWAAHYENRLAYERAMLGEAGGTIADQVKPEKGGACRCWASPHRGGLLGWSFIQKVNKVSVTVLDNYGNGGRNFTRTIPFDKLKGVMTAPQVQDARNAGTLVEAEYGTGFYLRTTETPPPAPKPIEPTPGAAAIDAMKATLKAGVQVVVAPQLFPTPQPIAEQMAELADLEPGQRVLEPSAGTGNLLDVVRRSVDGELEVVAVERYLPLVNVLRSRWPGVDVRDGDFLECNGDLGKFDRILMNPPFERGADIEHIEHAKTFLKPGGRLVAICANGPRQNQRLKPQADQWIDLPAGTFKDAGTDVNTALLVICAPS